MLGSMYAHYPEVLTDSFAKMNDEYASKANGIQNNIFIRKIIGFYILLFGIPEIGFQVRSFHFLKSLSILKKSPKVILDAGMGIGSYSFYLHNKYPRAQIDGIDIDKEKINFCNYVIKKECLENIKISYKNILTSTIKENHYDLIINIDVLEHIKNYKQVLKNFYKMLSPGGYLFIHTPHTGQKRLFSTLKNWHHEDHVREGFTKKELIKDLESVGFKIVLSYRSFGFINRLTWELNHILLTKNVILAAIFYPILSLGVLFDNNYKNANGWGIVILARKIKK